MTLAERAAAVEAVGEQAYRAAQVSRQYFVRHVSDPDLMTDIPVSARPQLAAVLSVVSRGLVDRDPEGAAVVQGAARSLGPNLATVPASIARNEAGRSRAGGLIVEVLRETSRSLLDTLGDERMRELRERGTRMDIDEAVAYTLTHIDAYRRQGQPSDQPDPDSG